MSGFIEDEIWALHVAPHKTYTQNVQMPFRITMAALGQTITSQARSSVILRLDETEYVLCSLTAGKIEQQQLSQTIVAGENITLFTDGENTIHLTGNFLSMEEGPSYDVNENYSDDDESEDDDDYDEDDSFIDDDSEEEEEQGKSPKIEEIDSEPKGSKNNVKGISSDEEEPETPNNKQTPVAKQDTPNNKQSPVAKQETPKQQQNAPKKQDIPQKQETPKKHDSSPQQQGTSQKQDTPKSSGEFKKITGGVEIKDTVLSNSDKKVKKGSKVHVVYKGTLSNGNVFDSNNEKNLFQFQVGKGSVIKGLDIGVEGMTLNSTRIVKIPAALAYGSKKLPGIPANSDLTFQVQLKRID
ncbi:peptidyl-prolyl cis-trans isomerase [Mitosporidium daphniae]|uniref:peptidylprolyl isomerase n=1 Tax=Mitosporidium daphniae TaxID=1485682 RepID=A0A098VQK3_9MICR|nr:peptidyl-prolyl cis-trans isomerase [Mitosporidium daphniae]KGG51099.1 peptidyl-prolyl cis-trans isomerase [Mitosporidium daphniae]|eukprot:XP_013237548.1 peptidyl-prolyl cis-trans isomerase [Mitosporidium daphniae]